MSEIYRDPDFFKVTIEGVPAELQIFPELVKNFKGLPLARVILRNWSADINSGIVIPGVDQGIVNRLISSTSSEIKASHEAGPLRSMDSLRDTRTEEYRHIVAGLTDRALVGYTLWRMEAYDSRIEQWRPSSLQFELEGSTDESSDYADGVKISYQRVVMRLDPHMLTLTDQVLDYATTDAARVRVESEDDAQRVADSVIASTSELVSIASDSSRRSPPDLRTGHGKEFFHHSRLSDRLMAVYQSDLRLRDKSKT